MKIHLLLTTILVIYYVLQIFKGVNSIDTKNGTWIINKNNLVYIVSEKKFTSTEAEEYCKSIDSQTHSMDDVSQAHFMLTIYDVIYAKFGRDISFWLKDDNPKSPDQCTAISRAGYFPDYCTSLKGVICTQKIIGAILYYKNGSHIAINAYEVIRFCNPHNDNNDNLLQHCLVELYY